MLGLLEYTSIIYSILFTQLGRTLNSPSIPSSLTWCWLVMITPVGIRCKELMLLRERLSMSSHTGKTLAKQSEAFYGGGGLFPTSPVYFYMNLGFIFKLKVKVCLNDYYCVFLGWLSYTLQIKYSEGARITNSVIFAMISPQCSTWK